MYLMSVQAVLEGGSISSSETVLRSKTSGVAFVLRPALRVIKGLAFRIKPREIK